MAVFIMSFIFFMIMVAAMAVGVIFSGKRIAGSCGGIGNIDGFEKPNCSCKKPCEKRLKELEQLAEI